MTENQTKVNEKVASIHKNKKFSKIDLYRAIANMMEMKSVSDSGDFHERFYVVQSSNGAQSIILADKHNVCRPIVESYVVNSILNYCHLKSNVISDLRDLDHHHAKNALDMWRALVVPVDDPNMIAEKNDDSLCYHRMPFDLIEPYNLETEAPLFYEFLGRTTNSRAKVGFLGSITMEQSNREQYLWLYGDGMNGKSSLIRLLSSVFGSSSLCTTPPKKDDSFWSSALLSKRIVMLPDVNNTYFVTSGQFKNLTGGDKIRIERKMQDSFESEIKCKFIISSNFTPTISSSLSDQRRIIYCEIDKIGRDPDPDYDANLLKEAPYIFGYCRAEYLKMCPSHGFIPTDKDSLDVVTEDNDADYERVFQANFSKCVDPSLPKCRQGSFLPVELSKLMKNLSVKKHWEREFKRYIKIKHGIFCQPVKVEHGVVKKYVGASINVEGACSREEHLGYDRDR